MNRYFEVPLVGETFKRLQAAGVPLLANDNISLHVVKADIAAARSNVELLMEQVLEELLIDWRNDPNTQGTPKRFAKMLVDEVMRGRFLPPPACTVSAMVAVAAVTAVGYFTDRIRLALELEAHQLLGGDLVLVADHPWDARMRAEALRFGLQTAETIVFPSMVQAEGRAQLADIKAVSAGYPLRGRLGTASAGEGERPVAGTAWLDERLSSALAVGPGQIVQLGQSKLPVAAILTLEPDRGINFFTLAPRLMMHIDDLPGSGLVLRGSRVTYRFLVVFQFYNLIPSLTARENVAAVTEIAPSPMRPEEALRLVGLEARLDHFPAQLSGGEQHPWRLPARLRRTPPSCFATNPPARSTRRPASSSSRRWRMVNRELGTLTVLITHNVGIAEMADRVIRLSDGQIAEIRSNAAKKPARSLAW